MGGAVRKEAYVISPSVYTLKIWTERDSVIANKTTHLNCEVMLTAEQYVDLKERVNDKLVALQKLAIPSITWIFSLKKKELPKCQSIEQVESFMKTRKYYYIQSSPHGDKVYHHAQFTALKKILQTGKLVSGVPWKPISFTTDPGRYLSPIPFFAPTVDGYVEFQVHPQMEDLIPAIYKSCDEALLESARKHGMEVFEQMPLQHKYVQRFTLKRDTFVNENEWMILSPEWFFVGNFTVHIVSKFYKRFVKGLDEWDKVHVRVIEKAS
jgi:hypothetical protein